MADYGAAQRLLADNYGGLQPEDVRRKTELDPWAVQPSPPPPAPRAELRAPYRPSDPFGPDEQRTARAATSMGENYRSGSYSPALLDLLDLVAAMAPIPGARRGKASAARAGEGAAGKAAGSGAEARGIPERGGLPGGDRELPSSGRPLDPYSPVPGQPATVKIPGHGEIEARPIPQVEAAARQVAREQGRPYETPSAMPPFDPERAARIAQAFDHMQHNPTDPKVRQAYEAMIEETLGQYKALKDQGFEFRFNEPGQDPYRASPALGYLDATKGKLSVFPTLEGFGSLDQIRDNPLLGRSGEKFGGQDATHNDIFRAVHDMYGHFGPGNPFFRAPGEERAWGHHSMMYGPEAAPAMTSETRGQNSWVNYGPYAEKNKGASGADTTYADQKIGLMPDWTWKEGAPEKKQD